MTIPFYKKRPQWWIKLLNIFHITEKQYWTIFTYTIILIISALLLENHVFNSHINDCLFYYAIISSITTPFGHYWIQYTLHNNLADDWFKNFLVNEQAVWILSALASPFIFIGVLLRYYFTK
ncbi:hypothetical protein A1D29_07640 [Pasteurellaceae bacterium Orientalotternb1]|nr:hypothetical protein A1D29_07640 [Pasteurellaceae bacterium Orientalotternb1]